MADSVLTFPSEYYREHHSRRSSLMAEYKVNMLLYLQKTYPTIDLNKLKRMVDIIIAKEYKSTQLKYIAVPTPGKMVDKSNDLLETTNEMNTDIHSPYGAAYNSVDILKSLFSEYIEDNQKERKAVKHEMFIADAKGDKAGVRMNNLKQMNIKININVLSGVMLSSVTFRSAINYNAITSTSRFSIMTAYATVELAFASNYYFQSEDRGINWIINLLRIMPQQRTLQACIDKYNLAIPSIEKVFSAYAEQINIYSPFCKNESIKKLIYDLSDLERTFIYYAVNVKRLFQDNEHFRPFFEIMLDVSKVPIIEGEIPKVAKLKDGIVHTFAVIVLSDVVGKLTMEDIDNEHPDVARKLYSTYAYLEHQLGKLENLFENFVFLPIIPSDITAHKNMIRRTVLLSDTDSILFTNMNWIEWFSGSIAITEPSARFNAAIVTIISKFLEHMFAYMSASMNIDLVNMKTIAIKNEFMYDLFLRTPISKHYAGYVKYREGVMQSPYKFDLKGKNFKGSDLCKETTSYVKWFIKYIFDSFLKTYELHPEDLIIKTIIFEQRIKHSINEGEVTFLTQKPIQLKQAYKNAESSNYLYYELWQAVFSEKYGDLNLPQKTKELPITEVSIQNTTHLNHIKELDRDIYNKFIDFMKKYPKRKFSRVLIPMDIVVPAELRAIANYRKVCAANCYSLDLILRSFNIVNYPNGKQITLFSDTYPHLILEITDDYRKTITEEADQIEDSDDFTELDEENLHDEDWGDEEDF